MNKTVKKVTEAAVEVTPTAAPSKVRSSDGQKTPTRTPRVKPSTSWQRYLDTLRRMAQAK